MLVQKKNLIFLFITIMPLIIYSQECTNIERNIYRKDRSVFLLDRPLRIQNLEDILSEVDPKDTASVRTIIQDGSVDENYISLLNQKGFQIKKINTIEEFYLLPPDSTILTAKEIRIVNEYWALSRKADSLNIQNKSSNRIIKKMRKKKYVEVMRKAGTMSPILFGMYPIYKYQGKTLLMYSITVKQHSIPFVYEICH